MEDQMIRKSKFSHSESIEEDEANEEGLMGAEEGSDSVFTGDSTNTKVEPSKEDNSVKSIPKNDAQKEIQIKKPTDFANYNISKKYLRQHFNNVQTWMDYNINLLIDSQEYAVDSVKLEWLLRRDEYTGENLPIDDKSSPSENLEKPARAIQNPYYLENVEEKRRLYNLMSRNIPWT